MDDITLDVPVDGTDFCSPDFLNSNLRNGVLMLLAPPTCILAKTDTQTIYGSAAWNALAWTDVLADSEDASYPIFDAANPTRLTCQTPGWYELIAAFSLGCDNDSGNTLAIVFRVNGSSSEIYGGEAFHNTSDANHKGIFATVLPLDTADYVEVLVKTSRGTDLTSLTGGWFTPRVSMQRIRGL